MDKSKNPELGAGDDDKAEGPASDRIMASAGYAKAEPTGARH